MTEFEPFAEFELKAKQEVSVGRKYILAIVLIHLVLAICHSVCQRTFIPILIALIFSLLLFFGKIKKVFAGYMLFDAIANFALVVYQFNLILKNEYHILIICIAIFRIIFDAVSYGIILKNDYVKKYLYVMKNK